MSRSPLRVVVVDDSDDVRALLRLLIAREPGMEIVAEAADGADGMTAAVDHGPDVVITDLHMPGVDGLELTRSLRADDRRVPVLLLTSSLLPDLDELAEDAGVTTVVHKSAGLEAIVSALRSLAPPRQRATSER